MEILEPVSGGKNAARMSAHMPAHIPAHMSAHVSAHTSSHVSAHMAVIPVLDQCLRQGGNLPGMHTLPHTGEPEKSRLTKETNCFFSDLEQGKCGEFGVITTQSGSTFETQLIRAIRTNQLSSRETVFFGSRFLTRVAAARLKSRIRVALESHFLATKKYSSSCHTPEELLSKNFVTKKRAWKPVTM